MALKASTRASKPELTHNTDAREGRDACPGPLYVQFLSFYSGMYLICDYIGTCAIYTN